MYFVRECCTFVEKYAIRLNAAVASMRGYQAFLVVLWYEVDARSTGVARKR
jgi:hypothetical protein